MMRKFLPGFILCCLVVSTPLLLFILFGAPRAQRSVSVQAAITVSTKTQSPTAVVGHQEEVERGDKPHLRTHTSSGASNTIAIVPPKDLSIPALTLNSTSTNSQLPVPLEILQEYKRWHSVESLENNPDGRKFLVGEYACPRQAGMTMRDIRQAMLHAIATNRTFLIKYRQNSRWLDKAGDNSKEQCDRLMRPNSWIPSYDEWKEKLGLERPVRLHHNSHKEQGELAAAAKAGKRLHEDVSHKQAVIPSNIGGRIVANGIKTGYVNRLWLYDKGTAKYFSDAYGDTLIDADRIRMLYSEGIDFLYGMLFREMFTLTDELIANVKLEGDNGEQVEIDSSAFTIGLHSRHEKTTDTGDDIHYEIECLEELLSFKEEEERKCQLFIMSDRENTVTRLREYAATQGCSAVSVAHIAVNDLTSASGDQLEHGPWAGAGYFRDLVLVTKARSGFAGRKRSSSSLLFEIIDYDRRMEALGQDQAPLQKCYFSENV